MGETVPSSLAALRALFEGAPATLELLAQATRRSPAALRKIAAAGAWRAPETAVSAAAMERRLLLLSDRLVGELERASAEGERTGIYDKARIDALSSMLRMIERIGETTRGPERASEEQTRSDEEMAAALERIDTRILGLARDLARQLAAEMGAAQPAAEPGGAD
ncbi:hypothetical protein [Nitratireductor sp. ZSWI3]|uniref:hypothetical protein n=1 Tax=Nitratireductor sp. ZSWI3 TaxID=2966359 RepID=UPI0021502BDC|nr:hypothetical protein [Nitratireductor sp. ZSWI3]MCR4265343.1 hypothetical protein [Nitratireductor sp. ZSWI3]